MTVEQKEAIEVSLGATLPTYARGSAPVPHLSQRVPLEVLKIRVLRLRRAGASYRRIAAELPVSYQVVAGWLDAPGAQSLHSTGVVARESAAGAREASEPAIPTARVDLKDASPAPRDELALEARVNELCVEQAALRQDLRSVESRLLGAVKQVADSVKALLRRVPGRSAGKD
jgi:hypothetical protein